MPRPDPVICGCGDDLLNEYPYIYRWGNNPVRAKYQGKKCRILICGKMGTVEIEFEDGFQVITSRRALRKP